MSDTVAKRSPKSEAMVTAGAKGRALMGGTAAMRAAGTTYLPMFEAESAEAYKPRLAASWLFNGYRKTVRDMTGRVFSAPVEIGEDADSVFDDWGMNIDLQGRDLSTFAREVFQDALSGPGIGYILVDAPRREGVITRAQAQAMNLRPYLTHLRAEDVLGWRSETINEKPTLTQIRIFETVTEQDPDDEFADIDVEQVRVMTRGEGAVTVRLYRKNGKTGKWFQHGEEYATGLDEVTVAPFYANRSGFFTGESLLDDLADTNVAHWQSQSDQRNILHVARVPILHATGRTEGDKPIVIGAGMAVSSMDVNARLEWVEHTGAAIAAGRQDLKDLEFQMETHGLQLLVAQPGGQSATGETLDAQKETSQLAMTADALKDALEMALHWMGVYAGYSDLWPGVSVNTDFGAGTMTAQEMSVLLSAVNTGNMSRETFLAECARRGMVRPDLDVEKEVDAIGTDSEGLMTDGAI